MTLLIKHTNSNDNPNKRWPIEVKYDSYIVFILLKICGIDSINVTNTS